MKHRYEYVYKFLLGEANHNSEIEKELDGDPVHFFVRGSNGNKIESLLFEFGFFEDDYITDIDYIKFFKSIKSLRVKPAYAAGIKNGDGLLYIEVEV